MLTLAHISDVHLGPLPRLSLQELASKRITGFINWHRNRQRNLFPQALTLVLEHVKAQQPDHLAVTGDLVNLATDAEILRAADWLKETGSPEWVSVVPGNHDAYVRGALKKAQIHWRGYMQGDADPAVPDAGWHRHDRPFPYLRRRGNVAIIGCSTAVATPPFSASGLFGPKQAAALRDMLERTAAEGLLRVVLIHHPPVHGATEPLKRMIGIDRFARVIKEAGAEIVLHGHTHLNTIHHIEGPDRKVPVIGIASASQGPGGKRPPGGYNLFSLDVKPGAFLIRRQHFQLDASGSSLAENLRDDFSVIRRGL